MVFRCRLGLNYDSEEGGSCSRCVLKHCIERPDLFLLLIGDSVKCYMVYLAGCSFLTRQRQAEDWYVADVSWQTVVVVRET